MIHAQYGVKNLSKAQRQLGRNVARLRVAAKLTQEQLAERSDIHWRYLQKIEKGVNLSFDVLARIQHALHCTWNDLLRGID